ncbi:MAG: glycerol-3-phosphate acyltransferase [Candidatus Heimdallarchaeota archaeon]
MAVIDYLWMILALMGSYVIGSIPFSVWLGKLAKGIDLRKHNVGNPGGMNAILTYGILLGVPIMLLDFFKGTVVIALLDHIFSLEHFSSQGPNNFWHTFVCLLGPLFCAIGHSYSVFLKFNGGQGLGVFMGVLIYLNPLVFLIHVILITLLMASKKFTVRVASFIVALLDVIAMALIPFVPPWNFLPQNPLILNETFLQLKAALSIFILGLGLVVRMFHTIKLKSKSAAWKIAEKGEQKFKN